MSIILMTIRVIMIQIIHLDVSITEKVASETK